jgi:hypothetical protein
VAIDARHRLRVTDGRGRPPVAADAYY